MTLRGYLAALFPASMMTAATLSLVWLAITRSWLAVLWLVVLVYGVPVVVYRIVTAMTPVREGTSYISSGYSAWWTSHQIQVFYDAFPFLEAALRLVPGLYSYWLRLWGSRIGAGVHWTPRVQIADRGLLEVGDGVVLGHQVLCIAHVIAPRPKGLLLFVRRIRIGSGAFLGGCSTIGAGANVGEGASIGAFVILAPISRIGERASVGAGTRVRAGADVPPHATVPPGSEVGVESPSHGDA